jgi:molybdopterin-guanine dinucleotide biosynthesis protein A
LVLAGGQGTRMGGVDKGLQMLNGQPLVAHVITRLQPQVGPLLINANRHVDAYAAFGFEVVSDGDDQFNGPLAGLLAGLRRAKTGWALCVPCDAPLLPFDLAERLAQAASSSEVDVVFPLSRHQGQSQIQPTFCLLRCQLQDDLAEHLAAGGRKLESWLRAQRHVALPFEQPNDADAFYNANTLAELHHLECPHAC